MSYVDVQAVPPTDKFDATQNAIIIYEAIGQMDCPVYLKDNYTGTITYAWHKKNRSFGDESPEERPFRTAKCNYKDGLLNMYYPSDRQYVYRFFWKKDIIYKIETYNTDGSDAGISYLEYDDKTNTYYHLPGMNGVGIVVVNEYNDNAPGNKKIIIYTAEIAGNMYVYDLSVEVRHFNARSEIIRSEKYPIGKFISNEGIVIPTPGNKQIEAWTYISAQKRKSTCPGRRFGDEFYNRSGDKYFYYVRYDNH